MKPATKQITSLGLLLLGWMPLLFVLLFIVQQKIIRHEMREKLESSQLETIVIAEKDVIWMDKHEIWVNDQMFDIHARELIDGVYTFRGLFDEKETRLMEQNNQANNNNNEEGRLLARFFKSLQVISYGQDIDSVPAYVLTHHYYPGLTPALTDPFTSIASPPPDIDYVS